MNSQQALLWTALTTMIRIFLYIFYAMIKVQKGDKDDSDSINKKLKAAKPTGIPRSAIAKANHGGTCIASGISNLSRSKVEVVNVTNYHPGSGDTQKTSSPGKKKKARTK